MTDDPDRILPAAESGISAATTSVFVPVPVSTDFLAAQRINRRNTVVLIAVLLLIGAVFGFVVGTFLDLYFADNLHPDRPPAIGIGLAFLFCAIGVVASAAAILAGDDIIVSVTGAKEVSAEDEQVLHNVVEEMAIASGMPKPRIVVIETESPNAFAGGMRPERAILGVTRGLLNTLNREELQGVVAHEMSHIANLDIRYMTAVGILVGLIALVADGIRVFLRPSRSSRRSGKSGLEFLLILVLIAACILAPLAAAAVRAAVSRQREYLADATAVQFTRNPAGLIGALRRLGETAQPFEGANRATQHMFIVNPFRNFTDRSLALGATHPPLESRIERLLNLGAV